MKKIIISEVFGDFVFIRPRKDLVEVKNNTNRNIFCVKCKAILLDNDFLNILEKLQSANLIDKKENYQLCCNCYRILRVFEMYNKERGDNHFCY